MKNLIYKLKEKIDISEFISEYIPIKNGKGICPFHEDHNPSFSINREKQYCHCFGCNFSGDVIKFAQRFFGLSFKDTLKFLCEWAKIPFQENENIHEDSEEELKTKEILFESVEYFHTRLNPEAKDYLIHKRGLKEETIDNFLLGYDDGTLKDYLIKRRNTPSKTV